MTNKQATASNKAISALVLGILSLLCMGFITGIPSIIIGLGELKAIKEGLSSEQGDTITKTGLILAFLGTTISIIALIIGSIFIALGMSSGLTSFTR